MLYKCAFMVDLQLRRNLSEDCKMEFGDSRNKCVTCNRDVKPLACQNVGLRCKFCKQLMHAQCCGVPEEVYRFLVNQQSAGAADTWPCQRCARQQQQPSSAQGRVPPGISAHQPSSSLVQQPSAPAPATVNLVPLSQQPSQAQQSQPLSAVHQQASAAATAGIAAPQAELVPVARGGLRLCYNGYSYTKKSTSKNRIRWECSKRRGEHCKGAASTNLANADVRTTVGHTHPADAADVGALKVKQKVRQQVQSVRARPGTVLASAFHHATADVRVALGRTDSIKRSLRRQKRGALPAEPATLADVNVSGQWATTGGPQPQQFLIHDSGPTATDRVIVFASPEQLRQLATSDRWYMDGTFAVAPKLFTQLYVIRAAVGASAVTCAYALMTGKSQALYEEMLQAVVDGCDNLGISVDPTTVVCDFELAAMNAVRTTLGTHVAVQGCFFHLCQSTWRKVQDLGLAQVYRSNDAVRHFCGMLDALAFLPESDVHAGMTYIQQSVPLDDGEDRAKLLELLTYFDSTYVSGPVRRVQRPAAASSASVPPLVVRRLPAMFPPSVWNVFDATISGNGRTNNLCEAWNRGFRSIIGHDHPSLWCLVESLQQDAAAVTAVLVQAARGQPPAKRVKQSTIRHQQRLYSICCEHRDGRKTVAQSLCALGGTIRLDA